MPFHEHLATHIMGHTLYFGCVVAVLFRELVAALAALDDHDHDHDGLAGQCMV